MAVVMLWNLHEHMGRVLTKLNDLDRSQGLCPHSLNVTTS